MYKYVVYRSFAADPRDTSIHVRDILRQSCRNNRRDDITGFLHAERGRFYQYFEGPKTATEDLMSRLLIDRRHHDLEVRGSGELETRLFEGWDIGFASAHNAYLRSTTGDPNCSRPTGAEIIDFLLDVSKRQRPAGAATPQA